MFTCSFIALLDDGTDCFISRGRHRIIYIILSSWDICVILVQLVRNVMAHTQKPDFVFPRNGRVHLNRWGTSVQSTAGSRVVRIGGNNPGYIIFRGNVKSTGYPLHSPVSPSLPFPCVTVCHQVPNELYQFTANDMNFH